ncbi:hypothetical protein F4703DRAFT_1838820 [Phycomyces blakesleeanus]
MCVNDSEGEFNAMIDYYFLLINQSLSLSLSLSIFLYFLLIDFHGIDRIRCLVLSIVNFHTILILGICCGRVRGAGFYQCFPRRLLVQYEVTPIGFCRWSTNKHEILVLIAKR